MSGDPRERAGGEPDGGANGAPASTDWVDRRERLIDAFTKIAAERGYQGFTVSDVAVAAGLSESDFYEHFDSKNQCMSAAYDAFVDRLVAEARLAGDLNDDWPIRVREGVAAALTFVAETTSHARFFAVEAPAAGPMLVERLAAAISRFVAMLRTGRDEYPRAADLPAATEQVIIGGAACLVGSALLSEEPEKVPALEAQLVEIMLTPYLGRDEARRIAG